MTTPSVAPTYRIRGLPENVAHGSKKIPATNETADPTELMGRLLRAMPRPHVTDFIYHSKILKQVAAQWPTFSFLSTRSKCSALKKIPIHLEDYMDIGSQDKFCQEIIEFAARQRTEEKAIDQLISQPVGIREVAMNWPPLATALACYFYRGTDWLHRHQSDVLETILQSSEASYVALSTGLFQGDVTGLLQKIYENPRLTLDVSQTPGLQSLTEEKGVLGALQPHPVEYSLAWFLKGNSQKALNVLHKAAGSHALSAGICLGLEPSSKSADEWLAVANGCAEAFYLMGRVWKASRQDMATNPHRLLASAEVRRDPRWHYHWLRDIAPEGALLSLPTIWPSLWSVELILDLGIPIGLVGQLYDRKGLDPKSPTDSAVILWAANNTLSSA